MNSSFLRLDRSLTLYFFYPLQRLGLWNRDPRIPILMYHSISKDIKHSVHPYYQTSTSPGVFAEHMKFLYENKYKVIDLDQAIKILASQRNSSNRNSFYQPSTRLTNKLLSTNQPFKQSANHQTNYVVLTFDDGFSDFMTEAFPTLKKYDFSATVFLPTAFIGSDRKSFKGRACLTWEEVRELQGRGVSFGSHSVKHLKLNELAEKGFRLEIEISKGQIEQETGESIEGFCYPFAFPEGDKNFVSRLRKGLIEAGYKYGVTTMIGQASAENDAFFLRRIPVNNFDDLAFFKAKLEGGYDWLHTFQRFSKSLRKRVKRGS